MLTWISSLPNIHTTQFYDPVERTIPLYIVSKTHNWPSNFPDLSRVKSHRSWKNFSTETCSDVFRDTIM
jgi:hypothetical protein